VTGAKTVFVGVTGASGSVYALRLVEVLVASGHTVHACASEWGQKVVGQETGQRWSAWAAAVAARAAEAGHGSLTLWNENNLGAGPASGSFRLDASIVCPCSVATLGHLASGAATNLVHRACAVALKEGRPLVLVPRETPLSLIDLRNLTTLAEAGAVVLPAMPGFYHRPETIAELVDHLVGKILDRVDISHQLFPRWEGKEQP
jgi:4-hydroxy-3-polyprenylbenzoate decarboxylase